MHDTERAVRIGDALRRGADSAITSGVFGHRDLSMALELRPESVPELASSLDSVLSSRVMGAKFSVTSGVPLVRVRLSYSLHGSRRYTTVIAGMDVLSQIITPLVDSSPLRPAREDIVLALRDAFRDEESRLSAEVRAAADVILLDQRAVDRARGEIAAARAKKRKVERANFVVQAATLLSSGWSFDDLLSAVNEAVVSNVLQS